VEFDANPIHRQGKNRSPIFVMVDEGNIQSHMTSALMRRSSGANFFRSKIEAVEVFKRYTSLGSGQGYFVISRPKDLEGSGTLKT
jgi:hypothetical protein